MSRRKTREWFRSRVTPPQEMPSPEEWLLSDDDFDAALDDFIQGSFPNKWIPAERRLRADRRTRGLLMRERSDGERLAAAVLPDTEDPVELLREALPHLPQDLASRVRAVLEATCTPSTDS